MLFLKLLLMGVTCLLLITECNNKYSITLQPFYFIICLSQVSVDGELCFETVKRKLKNRLLIRRNQAKSDFYKETRI